MYKNFCQLVFHFIKKPKLMKLIFKKCQCYQFKIDGIFWTSEWDFRYIYKKCMVRVLIIISQIEPFGIYSCCQSLFQMGLKILVKTLWYTSSWLLLRCCRPLGLEAHLYPLKLLKIDSLFIFRRNSSVYILMFPVYVELEIGISFL